MKVILFGANGRMGKATQAYLRAHGHDVVCVDDAYARCNADRDKRPLDLFDETKPQLTSYELLNSDVIGDVVIDFSTHLAVDRLLRYAVSRRLPTVICATGHTQEELAKIYSATRVIPVFMSANMSLGVNLVKNLVTTTARVLDESFDVEIVETHHRGKLDSPSGTAIMLADCISQMRNGATSSGTTVHSLRGGTACGTHEIRFLGDGESIRITHEAENKDVFIQGAVQAGAYIITQKSGYYDMTSFLCEQSPPTTSVQETTLLIANQISRDILQSALYHTQNDGLSVNIASVTQDVKGDFDVVFEGDGEDLARLKRTLGAPNDVTTDVGKVTIQGVGSLQRCHTIQKVISDLLIEHANIYCINNGVDSITIYTDRLGAHAIADKTF